MSGLAEIQLAFQLDVLFAGDPDSAALPCWFAEHDNGPCEGNPRAAHFIKRRRVENAIWALRRRELSSEDLYELMNRAAWDKRNGVPSCALHDERHDDQAMPPLRVHPADVPLDVAFFAIDFGIEIQLEDRTRPLFSADCLTPIRHRLSSLDVARSERALLGG